MRFSFWHCARSTGWLMLIATVVCAGLVEKSKTQNSEVSTSGSQFRNKRVILVIPHNRSSLVLRTWDIPGAQRLDILPVVHFYFWRIRVTERTVAPTRTLVTAGKVRWDSV